MGRKIYPAPNLPLGRTEQYKIIVASGRKYKSISISEPASNSSRNLSAYITCNKVSQASRLVILYRSDTSGPAKTCGYNRQFAERLQRGIDVTDGQTLLWL
jgi:hypothetical protein